MSDGAFIIAMGVILAAWLVVRTLRIRAHYRRRLTLFTEQVNVMKPTPPPEPKTGEGGA